jgi:hypothetical protein
MFGKTNSQSFPITSNLMHYEDWLERELIARHEILVGLSLEVLGLPPTIAWSSAAE